MAAIGAPRSLVSDLAAKSLESFEPSVRAALPMFKQVLVDLQEPDLSPLWKYYHLMESVAVMTPRGVRFTTVQIDALPN